MKRWKIDPQEEAEITTAVTRSAGLSRSYLILLVLSTIIASFGLLANSTATVIGAMIVAPLMGPILGTGLAYTQGDLAKLNQALLAEFVGVFLCLLVSALIGAVMGPDNIDFGQSEILGRTRPTLLDLAVGLAAGLAGAYSRVNRQVSDSIAGVAIAVALVPPLCTSGLCAAGALAGQPLWSEALGAFLLFLANFLTIQFASIAVFGAWGLGHWSHLLTQRRFRWAMVLNLVLLTATCHFLWNQFDQLVFERRLEKSTRRILSGELARIPGASLDSLRVRFERGKIEIRAITHSPQEIRPTFAAQVERKLSEAHGLPVQLEIGTVQSGYVNSAGTLYRQADDFPPKVEAALRKALASLGGCEFEYFRITNSQPPLLTVFLSVRSPQVIDGTLVARLTQIAQTELRQREATRWDLRLTVRSTLSQVFDVNGPVQNDFEWTRKPGEQRAARIEARSRQTLLELYSTMGGGWARSVNVSLQSDRPTVRVECALARSPRALDLEKLQQRLRQDCQEPKLELELRWSLGEEVGPFGEATLAARSSLTFILSASQPKPEESVQP